MVLALLPAGGVSVGKCDVFMAACTEVATAAVNIAVKASASTLALCSGLRWDRRCCRRTLTRRHNFQEV